MHYVRCVNRNQQRKQNILMELILYLFEKWTARDQFIQTRESELLAESK